MTSRHSSQGGRRGIAPWIIVTVIAAVVVIAGTIGYLLIVNSDSNDEATCNSQVVLPVVSAPGAGEAITAAAVAFDATAPVARSACVSTTVTTAPAAETAQLLADGWPESSGAGPGVWVTDSEADLLTLEIADSALTAGRAIEPLATSPVVLAVKSADAAAVEAAGLSWTSLPAASGPSGTLVLPGGKHLVVALPDPVTNRATNYALQSVLLGGEPDGTIDAAAAAGSGPALTGLTAAVPSVGEQPDSTQDALTDLAAGTGTFTAVPVVASDLATFTATTPGLVAVSPSGMTVGDTVFAAPLTASWVTPTLDDASALFLAYLRGPGGDTAFTDHGFELAGQSTDTAPDAGPEVAAALATAIGAAPAG